MKRLSFVLTCALLLLMITAVPAMAGAPLATAPTPPANTAIFLAWTDGGWVEYPDGVTQVDHPAGTPVPADYKVAVFSGWVTMTLGLANTVPNVLQYQVSLDGKVKATFAQSKAFWTGAFATEPDSIVGPFNPNIGAGMWMNWMFIPLQKPAPGTYELAVVERLSHTVTDLLVEVGPDAPSHPIMYRPYVSDPFVGSVTFK